MVITLPVAHHRVELLEVGVLPLEIALILLAVHHEGEGQDMQTEFVDHVLDEVAAGIGDDLEVHRHTTRPSLKLQRSEKPELPAVNMRSLKVYRFSVALLCRNFEKCGQARPETAFVPLYYSGLWRQKRTCFEERYGTRGEHVQRNDEPAEDRLRDAG